KKILIDKMDKSESFLAALEHRECYKGFKKSYDLNKTILSTYSKVYSSKRSQKDKDEGPYAGSDQRLKKRKTSKYTSLATESLKDAILAKESSQPQSSYEAAATLTKFELKKILIDKMDKSESFLAALEHKECYKGFKKSYDLNKTIFSTYNKVYSSKRSQKDKDEGPYAGSHQRLKKRKTSKYTSLATGLRAKESQSRSSKGDKSQSKSSRKSAQSEKLEFEKLDWENPEGGDYPFDLTKPLPLVMNENRQMVSVD
nr:hypothetical protein [Tanacetum cinerariifolium]